MLGLMTEHRFTHTIEVRFRDCDAQGHVNHAVFFTYLEQCRLMFWRELTGGMASPLTRVIVARAECDYRSPAFFGDVLDVRLAVAAIGRSSFTLTYEIEHSTARHKVADGRTVMVAYDFAIGRSIPVPAETRALLETYL
jgi:acyl-CoA thioester hydrolase